MFLLLDSDTINFVLKLVEEQEKQKETCETKMGICVIYTRLRTCKPNGTKQWNFALNFFKISDLSCYMPC